MGVQGLQGPLGLTGLTGPSGSPASSAMVGRGSGLGTVNQFLAPLIIWSHHLVRGTEQRSIR